MTPAHAPGTVFWADEDEEEDEPSAYQVQSARGGITGTPSTFRPIFSTLEIGTNHVSLPTLRCEVFPERQYNCCFNCGGTGYYANVCPFPKVGYRGGAPL